MQLFFQADIKGPSFDLSPEESRHMAKALRKKIGDLVHFTDGKGSLFVCKIDTINPKNVQLSIVEREFQPIPPYYIHLAVAPTKNLDRMEWMIEKITEIGIQEVSFLRTVNSERGILKLDRLEKKMISACKQSYKTHLPKVNEMRDYEEFVSDLEFQTFQKFIAYVDEDNSVHLAEQAVQDNSYLVLIGPEGDFAPKEIDLAIKHQFSPCSLGQSRLRTETAGIVAVHTLNLIHEKHVPKVQ
ncbi:16S rRNA (uracil(1498)-N(3))-methyltransferase [Pararhodonellum marinum]|uniref:16S rRNA (uracil(1498)-N(3))-methyltransferase n=1 Tax=Pararhodonellum marinum TaxID=2755358 RepID=UPI0018907712|nr:16S rRNA (uracil(1498)-N(3))-methyltransferase [Pararhodonellum marinum]